MPHSALGPGSCFCVRWRTWLQADKSILVRGAGAQITSETIPPTLLYHAPANASAPEFTSFTHGSFRSVASRGGRTPCADQMQPPPYALMGPPPTPSTQETPLQTGVPFSPSSSTGAMSLRP